MGAPRNSWETILTKFRGTATKFGASGLPVFAPDIGGLRVITLVLGPAIASALELALLGATVEKALARSRSASAPSQATLTDRARTAKSAATKTRCRTGLFENVHATKRDPICSLEFSGKNQPGERISRPAPSPADRMFLA